MIAKQLFGRTGHESTRTLFGAAALARVPQTVADRTLDLLLKYGVNHIDTAANYGEAELRIGPWMDRYRSEFFLATKTQQRTYKEAHDEIRRSLERLHVNQIDLLQLHFLVNPQEWEVAMGPGGALEAAVEAREAGLIRFIGVTGHEITVAKRHLQSLERFDFDSVLLPYSYIMMQNPDYAADFNTIADLCKERNVALQTIKGITRRPWGDRTRTASTWYEPLNDQRGIDKAIHWIMGNPQVFINTVGDVDILPMVLNAASRFEARPSEEEMQAFAHEYDMSPLFV